MSEPRLTSQEYLQRLRERRAQTKQPASDEVPTAIPDNPEPETAYAPPAEMAGQQAAGDPEPPNQPTYAESAAPTNQPQIPGITPPDQEELLLGWVAPSRSFKPRKRQYYTTIAAIVLLICLILFFAGQFLPIAVVISVAFLAYILASVPPEQIEHYFTTYGVRVDNNIYYWDELGRFWFTTKYDQPILHIEVSRFPFRLTMLLGEVPVEEVRGILALALIEQQPQPSFYERAADWLQKKIPLEIDG
jgi:hypothetical protein